LSAIVIHPFPISKTFGTFEVSHDACRKYPGCRLEVRPRIR
jgi:hypothetical protein